MQGLRPPELAPPAVQLADVEMNERARPRPLRSATLPRALARRGGSPTRGSVARGGWAVSCSTQPVAMSPRESPRTVAAWPRSMRDRRRRGTSRTASHDSTAVDGPDSLSITGATTCWTASPACRSISSPASCSAENSSRTPSPSTLPSASSPATNASQCAAVAGSTTIASRIASASRIRSDTPAPPSAGNQSRNPNHRAAASRSAGAIAAHGCSAAEVMTSDQALIADFQPHAVDYGLSNLELGVPRCFACSTEVEGLKQYALAEPVAPNFQ